jgi:CheY-like chemotaxis protein
VQAESQGLGHGSTFLVRLPSVAQPPATTDAPERANAHAIAAVASRQVLVVDDNADAADSVGEALADLGHEVRVAYDGAQALELLRSFTPDVALVDIGLPVMDGYELARRIRAEPRCRDTRLVAVTGYGQASDREKTEAAGFESHLVKPVHIEDLEAALLGSGACPRPSPAQTEAHS